MTYIPGAQPRSVSSWTCGPTETQAQAALGLDNVAAIVQAATASATSVVNNNSDTSQDGQPQGEQPTSEVKITAQAPQQSLSYTTLSGGPGRITWVVQWHLSRPSKKGGWIVQQFVSTGPSTTYWEAWSVTPGTQVTSYASNGDPVDDTFQGFQSVSASASFYEGLTFPSSFVPNNLATAAGILPSTTVNPNLSGGTAPVVRTWSPQ